MFFSHSALTLIKRLIMRKIKRNVEIDFFEKEFFFRCFWWVEVWLFFLGFWFFFWLILTRCRYYFIIRFDVFTIEYFNLCSFYCRRIVNFLNFAVFLCCIDSFFLNILFNCVLIILSVRNNDLRFFTFKNKFFWWWFKYNRCY